MDKGVHPYEPESGANSKWEKTDYAQQTVEDTQEKKISVLSLTSRGLRKAAVWLSVNSRG